MDRSQGISFEKLLGTIRKLIALPVSEIHIQYGSHLKTMVDTMILFLPKNLLNDYAFYVSSIQKCMSFFSFTERAILLM